MALEIHKDIEWSLTWEARAAIHNLKQRWNLDEDIALTLLERVWPESDIYELPSSSGDGVTEDDVSGCTEDYIHGND